MLFGAWFRRHGVRAYSRRIKTEEKTKVVAAVLRTELIPFLAAQDIFHQDELKKRMNRIKATWRNGCSEKMDDHPVHTIPNHHPFKSSLLLNG